MVLTTAIVVLAAEAQAAATLTIQADQPGAIISSNLFGIFFEEINFAGEGGLYAEMIRNRSFYTATNANYWTLVKQGTAAGTMSVDATQPLNTNLPNSLKLTMQSGTGSVGAGNAGFWGMSLQAGATYNLNFYAMGSNGFVVAGRLGGLRRFDHDESGCGRLDNRRGDPTDRGQSVAGHFAPHRQRPILSLDATVISTKLTAYEFRQALFGQL